MLASCWSWKSETSFTSRFLDINILNYFERYYPNLMSHDTSSITNFSRSSLQPVHPHVAILIVLLRVFSHRAPSPWLSANVAFGYFLVFSGVALYIPTIMFSYARRKDAHLACRAFVFLSQTSVKLVFCSLLPGTDTDLLDPFICWFCVQSKAQWIHIYIYIYIFSFWGPCSAFFPLMPGGSGIFMSWFFPYTCPVDAPLSVRPVISCGHNDTQFWYLGFQALLEIVTLLDRLV